MLPGIFLEDEIILKERHKLLLGMRLDQHRDPTGFTGRHGRVTKSILMSKRCFD